MPNKFSGTPSSNGHSVNCPLSDETAHFKYPLRTRNGIAEANRIAIETQAGAELYGTGFQSPEAVRHRLGSALSGVAFSRQLVTFSTAARVGISKWNMLYE